MSFTKEDVVSAWNNGQFESFSKYAAEHYEDNDGWYDMTEDGMGELGYGDGRVTINGEVYKWEAVERIGGSEGSGEYAAVIFKIDGRLFRQEGYYASHYGTDWDGPLEEVEAYEKTVTDYRPVK